MPNPIKTIDFSDLLIASMDSGADLTPATLVDIINKTKGKTKQDFQLDYSDEGFNKIKDLYGEETANKTKELYSDTLSVKIEADKAGVTSLTTPYLPSYNSDLDLVIPRVTHNNKDFQAPDLEFVYSGSSFPARGLEKQQIADLNDEYLDITTGEKKKLNKSVLENLTDNFDIANFDLTKVASGVALAIPPLYAMSNLVAEGLGIDTPTPTTFLEGLGFDMSNKNKLALTTYGDLASIDPLTLENSKQGKTDDEKANIDKYIEQVKKAKQLVNLNAVDPNSFYSEVDPDGTPKYLWRNLRENEDISKVNEIRSVWGAKSISHSNYLQELLESSNDALMGGLDTINFAVNYAPKKITGGLYSKFLGDGSYNQQLEKEYNTYKAWSNTRRSTSSREQEEDPWYEPVNLSKHVVDGLMQMVMTMGTGAGAKIATGGATKLGAALLKNLGTKGAEVAGQEGLKTLTNLGLRTAANSAKAFGSLYAANSAFEEGRKNGLSPESSMVMGGLAALSLRLTEKYIGGDWMYKSFLPKEITENLGRKVVQDLAGQTAKAFGVGVASLTPDHLTKAMSNQAIRGGLLKSTADWLKSEATNWRKGALQGFLGESFQEASEDALNDVWKRAFNNTADALKAGGYDWIGDQERYKIESQPLLEKLGSSFVVGGLVGGITGGYQGATAPKKPMDQLNEVKNHFLVNTAVQGQDKRDEFFSELERLRKSKMLDLSTLSSEIDKNTGNRNFFSGLTANLKSVLSGTPTKTNDIDANEYNYRLYKATAEHIFNVADNVKQELAKQDPKYSNQQFADKLGEVLGLNPNSPISLTSPDALNYGFLLNAKGQEIEASKESIEMIEDFKKKLREAGVNIPPATVTTGEGAIKKDLDLFKNDLNLSLVSEAVNIDREIERANNEMVLSNPIYNESGRGIVEPLSSQTINGQPIKAENIVSINGKIKGIKNQDGDLGTNEEIFEQYKAARAQLDKTLTKAVEVKQPDGKVTKTSLESASREVTRKRKELDKLYIQKNAIQSSGGKTTKIDKDIQLVEAQLNAIDSAINDTLDTVQSITEEEKAKFKSALLNKGFLLELKNNILSSEEKRKNGEITRQDYYQRKAVLNAILKLSKGYQDRLKHPTTGKIKTVYGLQDDVEKILGTIKAVIEDASSIKEKRDKDLNEVEDTIQKEDLLSKLKSITLSTDSTNISKVESLVKQLNTILSNRSLTDSYTSTIRQALSEVEKLVQEEKKSLTPKTADSIEVIEAMKKAGLEEKYNELKGLQRRGTASQHEALCHRRGKMIGWRDNDRDNEFDMDGKLYDDGSGINCHRPSISSERTQMVELSSLGCLVLNNRLMHDDRSNLFSTNTFMGLCRNSRKYWGEWFSITLIDEKDLI